MHISIAQTRFCKSPEYKFDINVETLSETITFSTAFLSLFFRADEHLIALSFSCATNRFPLSLLLGSEFVDRLRSIDDHVFTSAICNFKMLWSLLYLDKADSCYLLTALITRLLIRALGYGRWWNVIFETDKLSRFFFHYLSYHYF